jgi:transposase, IS5 family
MGGQIVDATIVSAPKQHNSREENETIKEGETPEDWKSKLAKNRQKDGDARWTKKYERSYFGYKNYTGVDRRHKFVRRYGVSDASLHDSQKLEDVLDASNTASDVWADSVYRSQEIEEKLGRRGRPKPSRPARSNMGRGRQGLGSDAGDWRGLRRASPQVRQ